MVDTWRMKRWMDTSALSFGFSSAGAAGTGCWPGVAAARYLTGDFEGIRADARDIQSATDWIIQQPYADVDSSGGRRGQGRGGLCFQRGIVFRASAVWGAGKDVALRG
jgi:hypothetical protein